jgi:enoyl-CoA hydratase/carnithine racemase
MGEAVDVIRDGAVATVVMHRAGNNAIAEDLLSELASAFGDLSDDPTVRVVILASGYERYFSVGADLGGMASIDRAAPDAENRIREIMARNAARFDAIASCRKPVIAAIKGHALGGGCELALCCDYRVMVQDGRSLIGQTEASLGLIPGAGGTQRLPRLIGRARALPLLYEGTRLSAHEALAIGLVSHAVAPVEMEQAVRELAGRLAKAATFAIAMIKDAVNRGLDLPLDAALAIEAESFARVSLSQDAVIGIMSFLSKQEPEFTGR